MKVHNRQNQRRIRALDRRLAFEAKAPLPSGRLDTTNEPVLVRMEAEGLPRFYTEATEAKRAKSAQQEIYNLRNKIVRQ